MNEKGKRTQNEKRITKWKQKPFSILIIYLRARIAWIVACRSDSVSYWYTAAIGNEENHMWNKYIHDACVHIRRKTQWIQNAEWTQQWIYLVVTQTPSIKPSKMDLSWNTDLCFSSTPSPSLVQQRESERASERVREDKHTGMEIRRSDRKSWWEDERNVGFGLPVCLLRVQDCRILWNHTYILYFLNANKNRRSFDSVACLICVMLALVAVVILAAVRL